jgi:biopolymer transport protein ExbB/TolQ
MPRIERMMSKNLVGLLVSVAVVVAAPLIGLITTVLFLRSSFQETAAADPSHKAQLLAQGISESMNATAAGMIVSLLAIAPTIVFAVRLHRESKPKTPPS